MKKHRTKFLKADKDQSEDFTKEDMWIKHNHKKNDKYHSSLQK